MFTKMVYCVSVCLCMSVFVTPGCASVVLGPECSVELEVLEGSGTGGDANGQADLRVTSLLSGTLEGVGIARGEVYRFTVPAGLVLHKGAIVRAGAVRGGSLGADGKVHPWIHWEPLQDAAGEPLRDSRGRPVVSLSSGVEPVTSDEYLSEQ